MPQKKKHSKYSYTIIEGGLPLGFAFDSRRGAEMNSRGREVRRIPYASTHEQAIKYVKTHPLTEVQKRRNRQHNVGFKDGF